jgi:soluble lytic murein transglycosylase-like protein
MVCDRKFLLYLAGGALLLAQEGEPKQPGAAVARSAAAQEATRQAMLASIEKQRASVRRQAQGLQMVGSVGDGFYTLPWREAAPVAPPPVLLCEPLPAGQLRELAEKAGREQGLDPQLLSAIIEKESSGLPCAVSPKGALGLMQIMPANLARLEVADPFNSEQNVRGGARLLKELLQEWKGDFAAALAAYNAGSGNVFRGFAETRAYVRDILEKWLGAEGVTPAAKLERER